MPEAGYSTISPETGDNNVDVQFNFSEKTIRMAFIRKVYAILTAQIAVTGIFVVLFISNEDCTKFVVRNPVSLWIAFAIGFGTLISLVFCESVARTTPTNLVLLFVFTIAEGFLLGVTATKFGAEQVLLAVGITALICFSLTIFAFQTKIDFTACHGILFVFLIVFACAAVLLIFVPDIKAVGVAYACAGTFLFSIYLILDTQMMIGGNHKYALAPEDYIFAALAIYLDIANIFLFILRATNR